MALDLAAIRRNLAKVQEEHKNQVQTTDTDTTPAKGLTESERAAQAPRKTSTEAPDLTNKYKLQAGTQKLRSLQNYVLYELENLPNQKHQPRGVAGLLGVGAGKTLVTILAPLATRAERPVLILPPDMREAFAQAYQEYGKHWKRHPKFRMMTYSELSVASGEERLKMLNPDLIMFDEAHNLASKDSARTRKVLRYLEENQSCRVLLLSGTLTKKSLKDFSHLMRATLRDWSPIPSNYQELESWSNVLDSKGIPKSSDWWALKALYTRRGLPMLEEQAEARKVFGEHLSGTKCVVSLPNSEGCNATILIQQMSMVEGLPKNIQDAITEFEDTWTRPDGEEIKSALDAFRVRQQLSQGFFYRWAWPGNKVDKEWMDKRQGWNRACRDVLKEHRPGLDSPLQVIRALQNGTLQDPEALAAWEAWSTVKHRPPPPTVPVWLSDFLMKKAVDWAKAQKKNAIIWYADNAVGDKLREHGLPVFGSGTMPVLDGKVIACSIQAQGTGKNLQKYDKNLFLVFPSNGGRVEQLIGRTHRPGQESDEVLINFWAETSAQRDGVRGAMKDAQYQESVTGNPQKLLVATWDVQFDRFARTESGGDSFDGDEVEALDDWDE